MGGKALKNTITRRFETKEFDELWSKLDSHLSMFFEIGSYDRIKCYHSKPDHGDMDILIKSKPEYKGKILDKFLEYMKPNEVFRNDIVSFDFEECQIDLMFVPEETYDLCWHFFAYNDLGGFMGKIARSMKCQYGQKGLTYTIYSEDGSRKLDRVVLSTDPKEIFDFLGFDYYRFVRGFDHLEDIFEYVASSKFFRMATFDGSELNSSQKSRDMSRPNYKAMLDYWNYSKPQDKIPERPPLPIVIYRINNLFPDSNYHDLFTRIITLRQIDSEKQIIQSRLNGQHVMKRYNLKGGPLVGQLMSNYKEQLQHNWALKASDEELWACFESSNEELMKENNIEPLVKWV